MSYALILISKVPMPHMAYTSCICLATRILWLAAILKALLLFREVPNLYK